MAEEFQVHLQKVLVSAHHEQKLAKGLREVVKALESTFRDGKKAALCVLAPDVKEDAIKQVVTSLCKQNGVPLIKVESAQTLGQWIGLCKIDAQGNPRKVKNCSSVVVKELVNQDEASLKLILDQAEQ
mgnify:FL=1